MLDAVWEDAKSLRTALSSDDRNKLDEYLHGIPRGNGATTTARVYWSNKVTGITSDVPSAAALTPLLRGRIEIKAK